MSKKTAPPKRSDATRAAILAAAREHFASHGYEKATIRAIAADAEIDPAMVMRYFGNKEQLFTAAADFDLHLPEPASITRARAGRTLVSHFLDRWENDETLKALLRAAATNKIAANRLRQIFSTQLAPLMTALAGDAPDAVARAGLVVSQALGFALTRYILRLPPIVAMTRDEIVAWLGPTFQRYLTGKP